MEMNHVKREKKIEDQTKRGGNLSDNRKKTGEKNKNIREHYSRRSSSK